MAVDYTINNVVLIQEDDCKVVIDDIFESEADFLDFLKDKQFVTVEFIESYKIIGENNEQF